MTITIALWLTTEGDENLACRMGKLMVIVWCDVVREGRNGDLLPKLFQFLSKWIIE
jgi:hypothetical protein